MILKGVANDGFYVDSRDLGAWTPDGINNDLLISRVLDSHWTLDADGSLDGVLTISRRLITITIGASLKSMGAYVSFPTDVGKTYSVAFYVASDTTSLGLHVGAASTVVSTIGPAFMDLGALSVFSVGYISLTFTAVSTTSYAYVMNVESIAGLTGTFRVEAELRDARILTGAERHTYSNAASDPNGTEVNSVSGWSVLNSAVISSVTTPVAVGTYALSMESNTSPTASASAYLSLGAAGLGLIPGTTYTLSLQARHLGTGGAWDLYVQQEANALIVQIQTTDTAYVLYSLDFVFTGEGLGRLVASESNTGNNGGIHLDNLSIRESSLDQSQTGKGIVVYGQIDTTVVGFNADTTSWGGFTSTVDYLRQAYNPLLDYTGDWSYSCWILPLFSTVDQTVLMRGLYSGGYTGGGQILLDMTTSTNPEKVLRLRVSSDSFATSDLLTSNVLALNVWQKASIQRRGSVLEMYIDAELIASTPVINSGVQTNLLSSLWVGTLSGQFNRWLGDITFLKTGAYSKTESEIVADYKRERTLFERDSVHSVVGQELLLNVERPSAINDSTGSVRTQKGSLDGTRRETIYTRRKVTLNASSGPIPDKTLKYFRKFLRTVADGQSFSYDPYGTIQVIANPKTVWLDSADHPAQREGDTNWFTVSWSMTEKN